ncbi:MAG: hypothetical protein V4633_25065 [Pseudomonadota bacterium]
MEPLEPQFYLNGDEPRIVGAVCTAFFLLQHQVDSALHDPVNVAYFQFGKGWWQLSLEGSTIFWRESVQPSEPVNDRLSSMLVLVNLSEMLGVIGCELESITYTGSAEEITATLSFVGGQCLEFRHLGDDDVTLVAEKRNCPNAQVPTC